MMPAFEELALVEEQRQVQQWGQYPVCTCEERSCFARSPEELGAPASFDVARGMQGRKGRMRWLPQSGRLQA